MPSYKLNEKADVTLWIDADVHDWLAQGGEMESRINAILRAYYEAHRQNGR